MLQGKSKIFKLVLLSYIAIQTCCDCKQGCLACDNGNCQLCDHQNGYYRLGQKCITQLIDNCEYSFDGSTCEQCVVKSYLNNQSGSCIQITQTQEIDNCDYYETLYDCQVCSEGYYKSDDKNLQCKKAIVLVPNCKYYQNEGECLKCAKGFSLSAQTIKISETVQTKNSCTNYENDANCASASLLNCQKCKVGYVFNRNSYFHVIQQLSIYKFRKIDTRDFFKSLSGFTQCLKKEVPNCIEYKQFNKCSKCEDNYYLTEKSLCAIKPDNPIKNCQEYYTGAECRICIEGYFLNIKKECEIHTKIVDNCNKMSQQLLNQCSVCKEGFYLLLNVCQQRQNQVEYCEQYSETSDNCLKCFSNFMLSENKLKCVQKIENCVKVEIHENIFVCSECSQNYYFDKVSGQCIKVSTAISGCSKYEMVEGAKDDEKKYKCTDCQNYYYYNIQTGVCDSHDSFLKTQVSCAKTNSKIKNQCTKCESNMTLFPIENYCASVSSDKKITNCVSYSADLKCLECDSGYFLSSQQCITISIQNCFKTDPDNYKICTQCKQSNIENYYLDSDQKNNSCLQSLKYITENCFAKSEIIGSDLIKINTNTCSQCYAPFFPEFLAHPQFCLTSHYVNSNYPNSKAKTSQCAVFDLHGQMCLKCNFDYESKQQLFIYENACVKNCSGENQVYYQKTYSICPDDNQQCGESITKYFVCDTTVLENCQIVQEVILETVSKYHCLVCQGANKPLSTYSEMSYAANSEQASKLAYMPMYKTQHYKTQFYSYESQFNLIYEAQGCWAPVLTNTIKTTSTAGIKGFPSDLVSLDYTPNSQLIQNCKIFVKVLQLKIHYYACISCHFGFTGHYVDSSITPSQENQQIQILNTCQKFIDCQYDVFYNGLGGQRGDTKLSAYVTCHKCVDDTKIPTLSFRHVMAVSVGSYPTYNEMNLKYTYLTYNACIAPGIHAENTLFPKYCAVQLILSEIKIKNYSENFTNDINPICQACQPGYRPINENLSENKAILQCTKIENCDKKRGLTTFNKCMRCDPQYMANTAYDECLATTIQNCLQGEIKDSQALCSVCDSEYIISRNRSFCNTIKIDNCIQYEEFSVDFDDSSKAYEGRGCVQCKHDYIASYFRHKQQICVKDVNIEKGVESIQLENNVKQTTGFVNNCNIYSGYRQCSQCAQGFTTPDGKSDTCISISTIPNCKIYNNDLSCQKCSDMFLLYNGQCINGDFYITNCVQFTDYRHCEVCSDGYMKIPLQVNNIDYLLCYGVKKTVTNCAEFSSTSALAKKINCLKCEANYYPKSISDQAISGCVSMPEIPKCSQIEELTGKCLQCELGYYLEISDDVNKRQQCLTRTSFPYKNCKEVSQQKDECQLCNDNYYVKNGRCQFKPTGVINCDIFNNPSICLQCKKGFYQENNICLQIDTEKLIEHCLHYASSIQCQECDQGYLLVDNTCALITVANCLTYATENQCQQCGEDYFLTVNYQCQKAVIQNCQSYESPSSCKMCKTGFFLNNEGICTQVTNYINNCVFYETENACFECANNTILSSDKSTCYSYDAYNKMDPYEAVNDENCENYKLEYTCKVCKAGYYFENGVCAKFNQQLANCQYSDMEQTVCLICQNGYYQMSDHVCVKDTSLNIWTQSGLVKTGGLLFFNFRASTLLLFMILLK